MANDPRRTPLYDRHVELGARMVDFAGWEMPVYYVGINEEHRAVRARAGLFDVSHMGQIEVTGSGAEALLRKALASDIDRLEEGRAQYSFLLNDKGGIVDDLIVYRLPAGRWLLVVNAGNTPTDFAHLKALKQRGAVLRDLSAETAMVALQGPVALELLADIWPKKTPAPETIPVFGCVERVVAGVPCLVARTGYTGEPGVELMCAADRAGDLWDGILARREHGVVPSGLGARDTLRLEMGYPLHGHDIDPKTTPIEAGLGRFVHLGRPFVGSAVLERQAAKGVKRRLTGLRLMDRAIPREGYAVLHDGAKVGAVTSGTLSPSIDRGIGLAYIPPQLAEPGTVLQIDIRGRERDAEVVPLPFYKKES
ncbi:MAG: glycine cleavage system aminomethyltransferase GcvT [Actinomycetota bacterium]